MARPAQESIVKHGREIEDALNHLRNHRMTIKRDDGHWLVMICEHGAHLHYGRSGALYHGVNTLQNKYAPRTERLSVCPHSDHLSSHFFIKSDGEAWPAACHMHPLPKLDNPHLREVCQAAWHLDGWEAAQPIIEKHVRFDPLYWRLWELHVR